MKNHLYGALLLVSSLGTASALPPSAARAAAPPISAAQQLAIFPEQKQLVLRDQQERLRTIAEAQRCVTAAHSPEPLMGCLVKEHQQILQISARHHAAMLAILRQHGVSATPPAAPAQSRGAGLPSSSTSGIARANTNASSRNTSP